MVIRGLFLPPTHSAPGRQLQPPRHGGVPAVPQSSCLGLCCCRGWSQATELCLWQPHRPCFASARKGLAGSFLLRMRWVLLIPRKQTSKQPSGQRQALYRKMKERKQNQKPVCDSFFYPEMFILLGTWLTVHWSCHWGAADYRMAKGRNNFAQGSALLLSLLLFPMTKASVWAVPDLQAQHCFCSWRNWGRAPAAFPRNIHNAVLGHDSDSSLP